MEQKFISLKQVAIYFGLSPKTLYTWVEKGGIPGYKFGRVWRFDKEEIDAWIRKNCGNQKI